MSHKINFFAAKKGQEDIAKTLFEAFSKPYCIRIKQYNREEQIGKPVYQFEDLLPENVYKDFLTIKDPKIKIPAPIYVTDSTLLSKIILSKLYKSDAELFIDSNKSPLIEYSPSFFIKDNTIRK